MLSLDEEQLIQRILCGEYSDKDIKRFVEWIQLPINATSFEEYKKLWNATECHYPTIEQQERAWLKVKTHLKLQRENQIHQIRINWLKWIAVFMLPISIALYLCLPLEIDNETLSMPMVESRIYPQSEKAILITPDGYEIPIDSCESESLQQYLLSTSDGEFVVSKSGASQLSSSQEPLYNTIKVPACGTFSLTLADGTTIHLNANSILKYPVSFFGAKREVYLAGEGFFTVSPNAIPFYVTTDVATVKVVGTCFNVNTTTAIGMQTVLVAGKVMIQGKDKEYGLLPSQMAEFRRDGTLQVIKKVDVSSYTAWKDGFFAFNKQELREILKQIAQWYNVEISVNNQQLLDSHFTGYIDRNSSLDVILDALSKIVGLEFTIQDRVIMLSK